MNNNGRFRYTGQVWLPELGLYYYKARMYSPTIGRFMQNDYLGAEELEAVGSLAEGYLDALAGGVFDPDTQCR